MKLLFIKNTWSTTQLIHKNIWIVNRQIATQSDRKVYRQKYIHRDRKRYIQIEKDTYTQKMIHTDRYTDRIRYIKIEKDTLRQKKIHKDRKRYIKIDRFTDRKIQRQKDIQIRVYRYKDIPDRKIYRFTDRK